MSEYLCPTTDWTTKTNIKRTKSQCSLVTLPFSCARRISTVDGLLQNAVELCYAGKQKTGSELCMFCNPVLQVNNTSQFTTFTAFN